MQKILLYSPDLACLDQMLSVLENNFQNPIFTAVDESSLQAQLGSKLFSCGIVRVNDVDLHTLKALQKMRGPNQKFPLLIAADRSHELLTPWLKNETDAHLLANPFSEPGFVGLARKILLAKKVPRQSFRRYYTNQIAEIENLGSGGSLLTCMYNLSQGGAYCEMDSKHGITVGDLIKVKINVADKDTSHILNGKIVWTTPKGRFSGRAGFGFRFVSQKEAYQALMSKL